MYLLDNRWAPVTGSIGFLEVCAERAVQERLDWMTPILAPYGTTLEARPLPATDLESQLTKLLPLTSVIRRRELFVAAQGGWTAYFDNGWRGTDTGPPMRVLAQRLGCRGLSVISVPNTINERKRTGNYGAIGFVLYGPAGTLRVAEAVNDGGRWTWDTFGEPQPFEDVARYTNKRVRLRIDQDLLISYMSALGLRPFDASFYAPTGLTSFLIERIGPKAPSEAEYTLAGAQNW